MCYNSDVISEDVSVEKLYVSGFTGYMDILSPAPNGLYTLHLQT